MGEQPETTLVEKCYRCGTPLPEGAQVCPACGRNQYRTCYCGTLIPVIAPTCPNCGADWSQSLRIRRKSQHQPDWKRMGKFALAGSVLAVMAAAVLNGIITGLARGSLPEDQAIPTSIFQKLGLALSTVWTALQALGQGLAEKGGGTLNTVVVVLAGALIGAGVYLAREGFVRSRRHHKYATKRRRASSSESETSK